MSVIPATPKTLLDQLSRRGELDEIKWQEFDRLYRPVVGFFLRQKFHSLISDYEDITQETMVLVSGEQLYQWLVHTLI